MRTHRTCGLLWIGLMTLACTPTLVNFQPRVHVVGSGDTLMAIAWRYQLDLRDLIRWNELENPDLILVGQRLFVTPPAGSGQPNATASRPSQDPSNSPRTASTESNAAGRAPSPPQPPAVEAPASAALPSAPTGNARAGSGQTAAARPAPAVQAPSPRLAVLPAPPWQWPVRGPVVSPYGAAQGTGGGIGIGGELGTDIRASAPGQVVYAGGGLAAYGNLIIIKHNDTYLSAYGHNDELLVSEGDAVQQGQVIASMGMGPERRPQVHFEIRRNGTPVDPLERLPD